MLYTTKITTYYFNVGLLAKCVGYSRQFLQFIVLLQLFYCSLVDFKQPCKFVPFVPTDIK